MGDYTYCLSLGKLRFMRFTALEVLMYLEPKTCYEFLFGVSR